MKRHHLIVSLVALFIAAPALAADPPKIANTEPYEALTFKAANGITIPYRLLKPKTIEADKKYPLVLFLHGMGECGNDNFKQLKNGATVFAASENREKFPCFEIVPQTEHESSKHGSGEILPATVAILELYASIQKDNPVDAKRLYITGLSMGSWAVWDILGRKPDLFAAAVPITGGGNSGTAKTIAAGKTAIWCFHGGTDNTNNTQSSRDLIAALKKAGAEPKYTEYPGVGHDSWTKAYAEPELLPWLFAQHRE